MRKPDTPRTHTPALIGVITRSWASRGFCGAGSDIPRATDGAPAPSAATRLTQERAGNVCWPTARPTKPLPCLAAAAGHAGAQSRTSGIMPAAPGAPVAVPGTALLAHGPVVLEATPAHANLALVSRRYGHDPARAASQCEIAHLSSAEAPPLAAAGADHGGGALLEATGQTQAGDRLPAADGVQKPGFLEGTDEGAAVHFTETRSCQLAQYVSGGGWRGSGGCPTAEQALRAHGAGGGPCGHERSAVDLPGDERTQLRTRLALNRPGAPGPPNVGSGAAAGCGGAGASKGWVAGAAPGRGGESVAHVRDEVCMWRADVEDRAGRVAAAAARALLAPDTRELAAVAPLRPGECGAPGRRGGGPGGPAGRGASGTGPGGRYGRGAAVRGRSRSRGWRGREECVDGRLGCGEEEDDVSTDGQSGSPEVLGDRGGPCGTSAEGDEGARRHGAVCGGEHQDKGYGVGGAESLRLTGMACTRAGRNQGKGQQHSRISRRAHVSRSLSPDGHLVRDCKHAGGKSAVGECRAVRVVRRGGGQPADGDGLGRDRGSCTENGTVVRLMVCAVRGGCTLCCACASPACECHCACGDTAALCARPLDINLWMLCRD